MNNRLFLKSHIIVTKAYPRKIKIGDRTPRKSGLEMPETNYSLPTLRLTIKMVGVVIYAYIHEITSMLHTQ